MCLLKATMQDEHQQQNRNQQLQDPHYQTKHHTTLLVSVMLPYQQGMVKHLNRRLAYQKAASEVTGMRSQWTRPTGTICLWVKLMAAAVPWARPAGAAHHQARLMGKAPQQAPERGGAPSEVHLHVTPPPTFHEGPVPGDQG